MKKTRQKKLKSLKGTVITLKVLSTPNNTKIAATDPAGNVIAWSSGGKVGFKNTKKSAPFAAQLAVESIVKHLKAVQVDTISIEMKGLGVGRDSVVKGVSGDFKVIELKECTPIPHNGTRLKSRKRG